MSMVHSAGVLAGFAQRSNSTGTYLMRSSVNVVLPSSSYRSRECSNAPITGSAASWALTSARSTACGSPGTSFSSRAQSLPVGTDTARALERHRAKGAGRRIGANSSLKPSSQPLLTPMPFSATNTSRRADACCASRALVPSGTLS